MNLERVRLIILAICMAALGLGFSGPISYDDKQPQITACGRCGDGQCVKSCGETAQSCPRDCGGVPGVPAGAAK